MTPHQEIRRDRGKKKSTMKWEKRPLKFETTIWRATWNSVRMNLGIQYSKEHWRMDQCFPSDHTVVASFTAKVSVMTTANTRDPTRNWIPEMPESCFLKSCVTLLIIFAKRKHTLQWSHFDKQRKHTLQWCRSPPQHRNKSTRQSKPASLSSINGIFKMMHPSQNSKKWVIGYC